MKLPKPTTRRGALLELLVIVALAIGFALPVQAFAVKPYQIPSASMEPTLDIGQRVLVNRVTYRFSEPDIGDIVVFHPPLGAVRQEQGLEDSVPECGVNPASGQPCPEPTGERAESNFIKRIVAGPGDRLYIEDGHPVVNGVEAREDFIRSCPGAAGGCDFPEEITIPPDHYFMMGDNRPYSTDSRYWGPVPRDWIIGQAFVTYWPPDRVGAL
jgi:signal peptidase I